jgi:hypothetical protein
MDDAVTGLVGSLGVPVFRYLRDIDGLSLTPWKIHR